MKNRIKLLMMIIMLVGFVYISKNEIYAKSKADKVYSKFLKKSQFKLKHNVGDEIIRINYYLKLNIDHKGCKELLIADNEYSMYIHIFTVKKGKLKYIGGFFNKYDNINIKYNKYGLISYDGPGGYGYVLEQIKKGKLKITKSVFCREVNPYPRKKYYVNEKKCSKRKFNKYKKKYFSKIKSISLKKK